MSDEMGPLAGGVPGHNPNNFTTATSVSGPSVRRGRSITFRELGFYSASKVSSKPAIPAVPRTDVTLDPSLQFPEDDLLESTSSAHNSTNTHRDTAATISSLASSATGTTTTASTSAWSSPRSAATFEDSNSPSHPHSLQPHESQHHDYHSGLRTPSPPTSPISPRWDSLLARNPASPTIVSHSAYDATAPASVIGIASTTCTADEPPTPSRLSRKSSRSQTPDSLASESRDECPLPSLPTSFNKMNTYDNRHAYEGRHPYDTRPYDSRPPTGDSANIENFSRPRRPSVKYPNHSPDLLRQRMGDYSRSQSPSDPTSHPPETYNTYQHLYPRQRGQSISSNQSSATFASLPVRPPPDLHSHEVRGRSRYANNGNNTLPRPPMAYSRTESTGPPSFAYDRIPRMASLPTEELRSSYRSQLSSATTLNTVQTERSSVMTKTSSIASVYGPVDDALSVIDVMDMYEKGFQDDSPTPSEVGNDEDRREEDEHDTDSRPPTAKSELSRRRTAMLDALAFSLPATREDAEEQRGGYDDEYEIENPDAQPTEFGGPDPVEERDSLSMVRDPDLPGQVEAEEQLGDDEDQQNSETPQGEDSEDDDFPMRTKAQFAKRVSMENTDVTRDRYGFRKENQYITQEQYDNWNAGYTEYMSRRRKKWNAYLKESGLMTDNPIRFPQHSAKTKRFIRKGIPPEWRGAAWFYYAGGPAILAKHGGVYDTLLREKVKDVDREAIERDLHRTFPDNLKFRTANTASTPNTETQGNRNSQSTLTEPGAPNLNETSMITSLRRVLHAFSIYNPRIGYCQSLNFLAGLLLLFTETEEHAFWLLNVITRVYLPGTHEMSLEGANVDLGVLMTSIQEALPGVWAKIDGELDGTDVAKPKSRRAKKTPMASRLPPVTLCMTAWFMSCFIGTLPIETTLRVWDVFFYEGSKTLFRIALAIFKLGEAEIRSVGDPMEIFQVVQAMPRRLIDANALMEACFKRRNGFGHLSQDTIEQRRHERRQNVKMEKERAATGLSENPADFKRKNTLFGKKKRPAELM